MKHRDDRNNNGQQYNNQQTGQGRNTKNFTADHDYGYGYGYGSTQESRDFRNQPEERYQSAMDFGSHTYDPNAHHGQSYPHENSRSQNSRSHGSHDSERHGQRQWRGSGRDPQDAWQSRHNEGRGQEREERGYNDPRYSSSESNRMMERTSAFGAQTYGSQGAGYTSHAGKGPKGYKRSDDRIKEEVCDLIMRHDEIDGSDIEVEVSGGEVTLTGSVSDRSTKHMVENLIEKTLGVGDVHNQLRVKRGEQSEDADKGADRSAAGKKPATPNPRH